MELLSRESNTRASYPGSDPVERNANTNVFDILTRIFLLSDEEMLRAGICIGAKKRDRRERTALIIPSIIEDQDMPLYLNYF